MEGDPEKLLGWNIQNFRDMPGDGFAFTVEVRRQIDLVGRFDGFLQTRDDFLRFGQNTYCGSKLGLIHPQLPRGQIADMAQGRHDGIAAAQKFGDRFLLGRRFHNDQGMARPCFFGVAVSFF